MHLVEVIRFCPIHSLIFCTPPASGMACANKVKGMSDKIYSKLYSSVDMQIYCQWIPMTINEI